jgi:type VI secretion system secreted protein VgrG
MATTQTNRRIGISTPLGADVLLLRGFTGAEAISQLFHFDLDLLSESDSIKFGDVVGKNVTLRIFDANGAERQWNGFITRFSQGEQDGRFTTYRAEMMPWLWFLSRTADCRIFQNMKAPDIIKKIFGDLKFKDFELRLYGDFATRDYCVQYRETDLNFVSRLMEEEGICYYFAHKEKKHVLILANDAAAHEQCPNQKTARYDFRGGSSSYEDVITEWHYQEEFRPGAWSQTDYNFETPSTSLAVTVNGKNPYEIYEFPGEHGVRGDGDRLARIRLQEQSVPASISRGTSGCRYFSSGFQFTLKDHYRSDLNQAYLITSVRHFATEGGDYEVGSGGGEEFSYRNSFECIPFSTPYRPQRVTPQPFVQGCQTAVVVGPGGEEIYTDKHGRVKVQFHWDREGKKNENSSCWIRVSQPWAGQGWGAVSIPRIGQEVIVDFLEGDPDRPVVVGRVYNAERLHPFGLPGGAVVSGIKSNSTPGGGGYNEISLNDTKGKELIQVHGQYDMDSKVEHDDRLWIGHDETIRIDHDRVEEVKHDEKIKIGNDKVEVVVRDRSLDVQRDKSETVSRNKSVHVGSVHREQIDESMYITVGATLTENVALNYAENVGAAMEVSVGGLMAITVGAAMVETVGLGKSETIGVSKSENIGSNKSLNVGKDLHENIGKDSITTVGKDMKQTVSGQYKTSVTKEFVLNAKKIQLIAEDEINLKAGSAEIIMKKNGDIVVQGNKIQIKGSGDVVIKGSKVKGN